MPTVETLSAPRDYLPNAYSGVSARAEDFVSIFGQDWESLRNVLGIARPIEKTPGAAIRSVRATIDLQSGAVNPGNVIPYSKVSFEEAAVTELTIEKYAKAVTIEEVEKYGAAVAIERSDDAFRNKLRGEVLSDFYTFAKTGELSGIESTWQMALAMAKGTVVNKFQQMNIGITNVVGFVNVLDAYAYLGGASVTIQTLFGIEYVENFMGYSTLFLLAAPNVPRNYVIATPVENIDIYYANPANSDFARMGLVYAVDADAPMIGFHAQGNYATAVGESYAIMGMRLWAEYIDGIAVVKVESGGSLGSVTGFSTAAYTAGSTGDSILTVPDPDVPGATYWFKAQATNAPAAQSYLAQFDATGYTLVTDDAVVATTNGHKYRVIEVNGFGQVIADANGTVTAKT